MDNRIIIVVEDDLVSCELFREIFWREKVAPFKIVENGEDAVELCKKKKNVRLVLMDLKLPGINGCEALKRIKALNKNIPVVAQTAYAMEGDKEKYLNIGFDEYITKPINTKKLMKIINKYNLSYSLN